MIFLLSWAASALSQTLLFLIGRSVPFDFWHPASRLSSLDDPEPKPPVTLMVPVAGRSVQVERALHSLIHQDYPALRVFLATHGEQDPARELALELARRYPHVRHVEGGPADLCGQKNQNLLACLKIVEPDTAVYVFCDANHLAGPDFVRELVRPIIQGRARLCTGYRRTRLCGNGVPAVAFHALNRFMGLLESLPIFTQPWGGALAVEAQAFRELNIAELWSRTVVDDSSLAGLLIKQRVPILYCPGAILDSPVDSVSRERLDSWFFRQLFYPKFYTVGAWRQIGAALLWFAATCLISLALPFLWLFGNLGVPSWAAGAALAHVLALFGFQELLRQKIAPVCARSAWIRGLLLAVRVTYGTYLRTIWAREMVWHGLRYRLAVDGRVVSVRREGPDKAV